MKARRPDDDPVAPGVGVSAPRSKGAPAAAPEHVCARCPRLLTASCCEVKPHERLATLTWADVDRVRAATGLKPEAFAEWEWLDSDHVRAWLDVHPAYGGYFGAAPRRLGLKAVDGLCALLERGRGCSLDEEARPVACRLYPFDVGDAMLQVERFGGVAEARRVVERGSANACLAVEEASGPAQLYAAFGTTRAKVRALARQLREEIREHAARERKR